MADPDRPTRPSPPLDRSSGAPSLTDPGWQLIADAAQGLGISKEALRSKVKRGTIRSMKGNDGLLRVLIDPGPPLDRPRAALGQNRPTPDQPEQAPSQAELVADLQAQGAALAAKLAATEQRLADTEAHAAARLQDRDAELERLRHDHQGEVNRLRADHAIALDQVRAEAERLRADHQAELARLQQVIDRLTAPWWRKWFGE